ncbi:MAG TPA: hypothetical protein VFT45_06515 [Longimicrobium sp.]|nr:hypothetical protein [Longimicrobium sp.]
MKLNPEELVVSSFQTSEQEAIIGPGGTYQPTPQTFCYYCPPKTFDCPVFTAPDATVVAD